MTWYRIRAGATGVVEAAITGPIEAATAPRFLRELGAAPHVRVTISSPGGDAAAGLTIAQALRGRRRVEMTVEGLAASAATLPVCAGHIVHCAADALFMLHAPTLVSDVPRGTTLQRSELSEAATALNRVRDQMLEVYSWRIKRPRHELEAMLDRTTWLDAAEAQSLGLVDKITPAVAIAARFDPLALASLGAVPPRFRPALARLVMPAALGDGWARAIQRAGGAKDLTTTTRRRGR